MKKRFLAIFLAFVMVFALMPTAALAAGQEYHPQTGAELEAMFPFPYYTDNSFANKIPDGSTVYLEAKVYQIEESLWLNNYNNLTIIGLPGTKIILDSGIDTIMNIDNCKNLTLANLVMGHNEYLTDYMGCTAGVLGIYTSNVTMMDCELFGCGLYGFESGDSTITMDHCTVRDCSECALYLSNTKAEVKKCIFSGNGYSENVRAEAAFNMSAYDYDDYNIKECSVNFTDCTFTNNKNSTFYKADASSSVTTENCTFSGNGWDNGQQPAKDVAYASTQNVLVDGKAVEFQAYALKDANGNDTNYVKLRDVAYALNGTAAQFSVGWDQAAKSISVTSGETYEANGSEMKTPYSGNRAYTASTSPLYINGEAADLGAILLTDDAGSGYTYFKLRDLGEALGFAVNWSADKGIYIETK